MGNFEQKVKISVKDYGIGIKKDELETSFLRTYANFVLFFAYPI